MKGQLIKRGIKSLGSFLSSPVWAYLNDKVESNGILYYLHGGGVADNTKYIIAYHLKHAPHIPMRVITPFRTKQIEELESLGIPVCISGNNCEKQFMLSSQIVITDHAEWAEGGRFWRFLGKPSVQLWHGVGFKKVGYLALTGKGDLQKKVKYLVSKLFRTLEQKYTNTFIVSTSEFYTRVLFSTSFATMSQILPVGNQPRNDIFFLSDNEIEKVFHKKIYDIGIDYSTIETIRKVKQEGKKVILLAFTYRKNKKSVYDNILSLRKLEDIASKNNYLFVIKMHPMEEAFYKRKLTSLDNVIVYHVDGYSDPQPLLREVDALVTDFSSIYTDFTLMPEKPIIFYPYDYDYYNSSTELGIQLPYNSMTPGPKVQNNEELYKTLNEMLSGNDNYYNERKKFSYLAFSRHSPVSPLLFNFVKKVIKEGE